MFPLVSYLWGMSFFFSSLLPNGFLDHWLSLSVKQLAIFDNFQLFFFNCCSGEWKSLWAVTGWREKYVGPCNLRVCLIGRNQKKRFYWSYSLSFYSIGGLKSNTSVRFSPLSKDNLKKPAVHFTSKSWLYSHLKKDFRPLPVLYFMFCWRGSNLWELTSDPTEEEENYLAAFLVICLWDGGQHLWVLNCFPPAFLCCSGWGCI